LGFSAPPPSPRQVRTSKPAPEWYCCRFPSSAGTIRFQRHYNQKYRHRGHLLLHNPNSSVPQESSRSGGSPPIIKGLVFIALAEALHLLTKPGRPAAVDAGFDSPQSVGEPLRVHLARAKEAGRGREASSPTEIPWRGWLDIFWRTTRQASEDRILAIAGGVVFYGLLALFPAITALVSLYGLFATPNSITDHLSFLQGVMPADAYSIVQDQVGRVIAKGQAGLTFGFLVGLVLALWSANAGVKAVMDALNIVYEEDEKRGFIRLNLVSLAFTVAGIFAMLVAVGAVVVIPLLLSWLGFGGFAETILRIARWPVLMVGVLFGLSILYRYGPSRRAAQWKWISLGAVVATGAWCFGSLALSYYFANFANYNATYGSLGAAIGTMTWMWMSAIVVLFGAEINSEIEHQTARDTTVGGEKPLGMRGATMADTIGPAQ
jgi:membrane protein